MMIRTMYINMKTVLTMRRKKTMLKKRTMKIMMNMSTMKKCMKIRARADFEYNTNSDDC